MMLLTFSRRAAAEMQRRVERITAEVLGAKAGPMAHALNHDRLRHMPSARGFFASIRSTSVSATFSQFMTAKILPI